MFIIITKLSRLNFVLSTQKSFFSNDLNRFIQPTGKVFIKNKYQRFVDSLRITVSGGLGGNGYPKFQGLGGNGGNVYLIANSNVKLTDVKKKSDKKFKAGDGQHSSRFAIIGQNGKDLEIKVPVGITVILDKYNREIADLNEENSKVIVAFGGRGGDKQNFYCGTKGDKLTIRLDLKLLADVGMVGYPNAGKSTLLRALSRATPKIASYPFTTIEPNLGVIEYDPPKAVTIYNQKEKCDSKVSEFYDQDYRRITVADLPGLIEGAHKNIGLGHKFLKHIVRTNLLLFVVDINGFKNTGGIHYHESWTSQEPIDVIQSLVNEIDLYDPQILRHKPSILVVTKLDTKQKQSQFEQLVEALEKTKINVPSITEIQQTINNYKKVYETRAETQVETQTDNHKEKINADNDPGNDNEIDGKKLVVDGTSSNGGDGAFRFDKIIGISSVTGYNIDQLKGMIRRLIDLHVESKKELPISFKQLKLQQDEQNRKQFAIRS